MTEQGPYPILGAIYESTRSRSGRRWRVVECAWGRFRLQPLGPDVRDARSAKTGRWQGGVRGIVRREEQLRDPSRWRQIGYERVPDEE